MKQITALGFYFFILFNAAQAQTIRYSLKQCVDTAISNNADVFASRILAQTAGINLQQAKGNMLPDVNGNINHGANQGRSIDPFTNTYINQNVSTGNYSLTANLTLFNGLSIQNNIKQNQLSTEASRQEEQQTKDNITLNVILAYLQVLTARDLLQQAIQQREVTLKQVQRLEILDTAGAIIPSVLYDLKGQYASDEVNAVNAKNTLEQAKITLVQLMNVPYSTSFDVEPISPQELTEYATTSPDSIYQVAVNNLAAIKATDLRVKSTDYGVKAAKGLRYPSVSFGGGLYTNYSSAASTLRLLNTTESPTNAYVDVDGTQYPVIAKQDNFASDKISYGKQFGNNFSTSVGIGISIPIINRLQTKTQIRTAELQQKNAAFLAGTARTQLQQSVQQAYTNFTSGEESYKALIKQVDAFQQSFKVAEVRFQEGVNTSVDYLIAKNRLDLANTNLIVARYNYILRKKILDFYQGTLSF